jgi:uncharacterized protein with HEPN domain
MPRDVRKYLFDIAEASKLVSEFVAGKTLDDYLKSALLQSGVERQFEIIGEALGQLAKVDQQLASRITDFQKIVSFRNVLIHGYADGTMSWSGILSKRSFTFCAKKWRSSLPTDQTKARPELQALRENCGT